MTDSDSYRSRTNKMFPTTHWTLFRQVQELAGTEKLDILNLLIKRYWKSIYAYLRVKGFNDDTARDLVQEFLTGWLEKENFAKADPTRGRFRSSPG